MDQNKSYHSKDSGDEGSDKRGGRGGAGGASRFRKRICRFCHTRDLGIDYKRVDILIKYVSNKGKILPRRLNGNCAQHQRDVSKAIKRSRVAGFIPFSVK